MNDADKALLALHTALTTVAPDLHIESSSGVSRVSLRKGGPRMTLRVEYFENVADDPEELLDYANRVIEKLRQETA